MRETDLVDFSSIKTRCPLYFAESLNASLIVLAWIVLAFSVTTAVRSKFEHFDGICLSNSSFITLESDSIACFDTILTFISFSPQICYFLKFPEWYYSVLYDKIVINSS